MRATPTEEPTYVSQSPEESLKKWDDWVARYQWEERTNEVPFSHHIVAGSVAGVCEHIALFPVDTVRTRVQALSLSSRGLVSSFRTISSELGFSGFFRGGFTVCIGSIPAHAGLFSVYEIGARRLDTSQPVQGLLCGAAAQTCHDLVLTPTDVVKQRLQLGCYRSPIECTRSIVKAEGVSALFRSLPTSMAMNVPYGAMMIAVNEWLKHKFIFHEEARSRILGDWNASAYFAIAGFSGGVAGFLTTPFDLVRTRIQTQTCRLETELKASRGGYSQDLRDVCNECYVHDNQVKQPLYKGFVATCRKIASQEGYLGFWRGATVRTIVTVPSAAICWGTYNLVSKILLDS